MKNQGITTLLKEYSKPSVMIPKEMEMQELPNKVFKIIILKMLRELQRTQINNLTILGTQQKNKMRSSTER